MQHFVNSDARQVPIHSRHSGERPARSEGAGNRLVDGAGLGGHPFDEGDGEVSNRRGVLRQMSSEHLADRQLTQISLEQDVEGPLASLGAS